MIATRLAPAVEGGVSSKFDPSISDFLSEMDAMGLASASVPIVLGSIEIPPVSVADSRPATRLSKSLWNETRS
jgi:hypothetical protein